MKVTTWMILSVVTVLLTGIVVAEATLWSSADHDYKEYNTKEGYTHIAKIEKHFKPVAYQVADIVPLYFGKGGFDKDVIYANHGDLVQIDFTTGPYRCNFEIEGYGVDTYMAPFDHQEISFTASNKGAYTMSCTPVCEICGIGPEQASPSVLLLVE